MIAASESEKQIKSTKHFQWNIFSIALPSTFNEETNRSDITDCRYTLNLSELPEEGSEPHYLIQPPLDAPVEEEEKVSTSQRKLFKSDFVISARWDSAIWGSPGFFQFATALTPLRINTARCLGSWRVSKGRALSADLVCSTFKVRDINAKLSYDKNHTSSVHWP